MNVFLSQIYGSAFTAHCVEKFNHKMTMVKKVLSKPAVLFVYIDEKVKKIVHYAIVNVKTFFLDFVAEWL